MKINDSTYLSQPLQASQRVAQQGNVQKTQPSIEPVDSRVEKNTQSKSQNEQRSRFDVDQSAIALVEEQLQSQVLLNSTQTKQNESRSFSQYDEPSKQNKSAVAAYQTVDNIAKRESVKQVFGVDLIA